MDDNASVGKVNKPIWIVESKACEEIARGPIPKGSIAHTAHRHVEYGGGEYPNKSCSLHSFVLSRWSFQCVLLNT
jgi:hypothetical protein